MPDPKIQARFELDRSGRPKYIEEDATRHFEIQLWISDCPATAVSATYRLHNTYYEPIRYRKNREDGFRESISSFGDFDVRADIELRSGEVLHLSSSLYRCLSRTHDGTGGSAELRSALSDIREN